MNMRMPGGAPTVGAQRAGVARLVSRRMCWKAAGGERGATTPLHSKTMANMSLRGSH
jgi:hypothetical protein